MPYADRTPPNSPRPHLRDYQAADADDFLTQLHAGRKAIFSHHEQGLGKSVIALTVWREWAPDGRLLIVGPSASRVSWTKEIARWAPDLALATVVLNSGKDAAKISGATRVVVVTYDLCRSPAVRDRLRVWARDAFAVLDEYQYLRNPYAKRTQALYAVHDKTGILLDIDRVLLLSGTPVVSWPLDLWAPVSRWSWDRLRDERGSVMSFTEFRDRFHVVKMERFPGARALAPKIKSARNTDELSARLQGMAIRRLKTEVDLPPLTWQLWPIELSAADRRAMDAALQDGLPDHVRAALLAAAHDPSADAAAKAQKLLAAHQQSISVIVRLLGAAKASAVGALLADELDNSDRAIGVGVWNTAVADTIEAALRPCGVARIDGSTTPQGRVRAVDAFQSPTGPRAFVGQISACGTALTLTRASDVVMLQMSWTPGENHQFASRFHRIGQRNAVTIRVPYVPGTIDEAVQRVLTTKSEAAAAVIDA